MEPYRLTYSETQRFAPIVLDHLAGEPFVASLSDNPPTFDGMIAAAKARKFDASKRTLLVATLERQYKDMRKSEALSANLQALADERTLTITTGHQLCLFTGPLYVPLKILDTIKVATMLTTALNGPKVVPIFWMATEDHDRPEIDHAWVNGRKIHWPGDAGGAVGRMDLRGIEQVIQQLERVLGPGRNAKELLGSIRECYRPDHTLVQATRLFVNALFGDRGIVCLDADEPDLKRLFLPIVRRELEAEFSQKAVSATNDRMASRYKVQAHGREINLFHLSKGKRTRIIGRGNGRFALDNGPEITKKELLAELEEYPERASPNVLLRPLYQETILPNVAYIGGGGELAYWLQLKALFGEVDLQMPVLLLRSSVAIMPHKEYVRAKDLGISVKEIFDPKEQLHQKVARARAGFATTLEKERDDLQKIYDELAIRAREIDPTLERSAGSSANLAFKGLDHLEKRFIRVAKATAERDLARLDMVLDTFFPQGGMQERRENFMTFYLRQGKAFFDRLYEHLDPLGQQFTVLVEDPIDPEQKAPTQ